MCADSAETDILVGGLWPGARRRIAGVCLYVFFRFFGQETTGHARSCYSIGTAGAAPAAARRRAAQRRAEIHDKPGDPRDEIGPDPTAALRAGLSQAREATGRYTRVKRVPQSDHTAGQAAP